MLKKLLLIFLSAMLCFGTLTVAGCKGAKMNKKDLAKVIENHVLFSGTPVTVETNPTYNMPTAVAKPTYKVMDEKPTGRTKETLTVNREEGSSFGGGQYISKLFTEALSRAPSGREFAAFQQYIMDNGLSKKT